MWFRVCKPFSGFKPNLVKHEPSSSPRHRILCKQTTVRPIEIFWMKEAQRLVLVSVRRIRLDFRRDNEHAWMLIETILNPYAILRRPGRWLKIPLKYVAAAPSID